MDVPDDFFVSSSDAVQLARNARGPALSNQQPTQQ